MTGLFVNCDWGTTHFRLRAVRVDREAEIVAEFRSEDGVAQLAGDGKTGRPARFRGVLTAGLRQLAGRLGEPLTAAPVLISGMASSSIGWHELPYARVPLRLDGADLKWHELESIDGPAGRHRVILISGIRTDTDVMRGEETETVGLFQLDAARPLARDCLVILPGTHSKHIQIENQQITGFQTFMTGELYGLIGRESILRHSIRPPTSLSGDSLLAGDSPGETSRGSQSDFRAGVEQAGRLPLSAALFRVRTRQVLDGSDPADNRAFLSGVLVGAELAYLARDERSRDQRILLCAVPPLGESYAAALDALGMSQRLTVISPGEIERLSALGQACLLAHLSPRGSGAG